jgi:hypothetical protein
MDSGKTYVIDNDTHSNKRLNIEEEYEIDRKKPNSYHLITNSKYAECYIVDKEMYLKFMLTFSSDKTLINKYLDDLLTYIRKTTFEN